MKNAKKKELEEIERLYSELEQKDAELEHAKSNAHKQKWDTNSIFKFRIVGAFIVYVSYLAFQTLDIIYLIGAAFIFSMVMDSPIAFFAKRMHRGLAIFLSYFIMVIIIAGLLFVVLPFIFHQVGDVITLAIAEVNAFKLVLDTEGLVGVVNNASRMPSSIREYILSSIQDPAFYNQIQT